MKITSFINGKILCECENHKCGFALYVKEQDQFGGEVMTPMFQGIVPNVCLQEQCNPRFRTPEQQPKCGVHKPGRR